MTLIKRFFISFSLSYLILSLPNLLGFVIDWIPEASLLQKFKGYFLSGLNYGLIIKLIISSILGFLSCVILVLKRRHIRNKTAKS
jgi:hypothetical protein